VSGGNEVPEPLGTERVVFVIVGMAHIPPLRSAALIYP